MLRSQTVDNLSVNNINGVWGEAPSKVAGAAAPDNKPLPEGKGLGDGDREFVLFTKINTCSTSWNGAFAPFFFTLISIYPSVFQPYPSIYFTISYS